MDGQAASEAPRCRHSSSVWQEAAERRWSGPACARNLAQRSRKGAPSGSPVASKGVGMHAQSSLGEETVQRACRPWPAFCRQRAALTASSCR